MLWLEDEPIRWISHICQLHVGLCIMPEVVLCRGSLVKLHYLFWQPVEGHAHILGYVLLFLLLIWLIQSCLKILPYIFRWLLFAFRFVLDLWVYWVGNFWFVCSSLCAPVIPNSWNSFGPHLKFIQSLWHPLIYVNCSSLFLFSFVTLLSSPFFLSFRFSYF